ncbi:hypothetical protein KTQ42_22640 [Noviherbaspirillum sp. L7-7A]|uniref:hypothetical protein n=1 Tax=Noviherbaspirillum sp. L7-7A TaxID=2850560 RepID=UPI001C2BAD6F|nr:hypothetical protein [Noviherbaspirillum sp. L7-7A]MBV0882080.1 hypothetical protein [Noviherbaspirillum sp. L7-7A]
MKMQEAMIPVASANRGLGPAFARAATERSARKRYAFARRPALLTLPEGMPVWLGLLEAGAGEVMANETSRTTKARLSAEAASYRAPTTV